MWEEMLSWPQPALAPAAVRPECPERPTGGWPGDRTQQLGGRRRQEQGFSSLLNQTCGPREKIFERGGKKGAWGHIEEKPRAGSVKGSAGKGQPGPALGGGADGLGRGDGALTPLTV